MNSAQFLEFLISLSIQATMLVGITHWFCHISRLPHSQFKLWNRCYVLLLIMTVCGLTLPHLRVVANPWQALAPESLQQFATAEHLLGQSVLVIWSLGIVLSMIMLGSEWITVIRFLKSCRLATESEVPLEFRGQTGRMTIDSWQQHPPVRVLVSNSVNSPFCCQWHSPVLVLPEFLLQLPEDEITFIVRHELSHLHSGHPLQLFIERLVMTLFWFHPAIWWATRQSMLAREFACDDAAIHERREVVRYLKTLLAVAERGIIKESAGATLFFGGGNSIMALRGNRILTRFQSQESWSQQTSHAQRWPLQMLLAVAVITWFLWIPIDAMSSSRMRWSPWPSWSASVLRTADIPARDYEPYEKTTRLHEITLNNNRPITSSR